MISVNAKRKLFQACGKVFAEHAFSPEPECKGTYPPMRPGSETKVTHTGSKTGQNERCSEHASTAQEVSKALENPGENAVF
jgi:hypothetical protein